MILFLGVLASIATALLVARRISVATERFADSWAASFNHRGRNYRNKQP